MEPISRKEYRILAVEPFGNGVVGVRFRNGQWVRVDFRAIPGEGDLIAEGGFFAKLADDDYLAQVKVGEYGHWLEWPGELDFGADQIWYWGSPLAVAEKPQRVAS